MNDPTKALADDGLAPWRSPLARALHRNRALAYARYLQLATVRADGRPANRTVVFRGFVDTLSEKNLLKFVSDRRSQKMLQLESQAWAEACWYFPKTREQFRLSGRMLVVGQAQTRPQQQPATQQPETQHRLAAERQTTWQNLSDNARSQFYWPEPGAPCQPSADFQPVTIDDLHPPETFCLLLFNLDRVDHLELRGEPQNRFLYTKNKNQAWSCQSVNP